MKYIPLDAFERINSLLQDVEHNGTRLTLRVEAYTCRHTREERRLAEDMASYQQQCMQSTPPLRPAPSLSHDAHTTTTPVMTSGSGSNAVVACDALLTSASPQHVTARNGASPYSSATATATTAVVLPPPLVLGSSAVPFVYTSSSSSSSSGGDKSSTHKDDDSNNNDAGKASPSTSARTPLATATAAATVAPTAAAAAAASPLLLPSCATTTAAVAQQHHQQQQHNNKGSDTGSSDTSGGACGAASVDDRLVYLVAALNHVYGDDGYEFAVLSARDFVCHDEQTLHLELARLLRDVPEHCTAAVRQLWPAVEAQVGDAAHGCAYYEFCCRACDPYADRSLVSRHYFAYNKRRKVLVLLRLRVARASRVRRRRGAQPRRPPRAHTSYKTHYDDDDDDDNNNVLDSDSDSDDDMLSVGSPASL